MTTETETESIVEALQASWNEVESDSETDETTAPEEDSEPLEVAEADGGEDTPTEENEVTAEAEEASDDGEPQGIPAPEHWSSEVKEQFAALSPEAQQILIERDKEFQKGYQERVQGITNIQQAIEPYKQMIAQMGVSEDQAIRSLFATYGQLLQNPLMGIQRLAQNFGVWDQLTAPDTNDDFTDPEVKALREQIQGLNNQIQQLSQSTQQSAQAQGQAQIDSFKSAKDEKGNLLHPHFDEAIPLIVSLVQTGKTLEEAYDEAKWSVPAYRESQMAKKDEPSDLERAKKVRQAKKAADSVKPKGKAPSTPEKELSIEDELKAVWNELS